MNTDWLNFLSDLTHDLARNMLIAAPVLAVLMALAARQVLRQTDELVRARQRAKEQVARQRAREPGSQDKRP